MNLNHDGEVYKHCCQLWSNPKDELWMTLEDDRVEIRCIDHPEVLLGYADDLPEV